jgi:ATP synthase subunit 6
MIYSPTESFSVLPIIGPLNDVAIYLLFAGMFMGILSFIFSANQPIIPSNWKLGLETYHITLYGMVKSYIGNEHGVYFPFIYTMFTFLLFSNVFGLLPYSTTPTTHLIITFNLALFLLISAFVNGFRRYKYALLGLFIPAGTPLALVPMLVIVEILAYITRVASLGIRITVNMVTGHTLVKVFGGFIWEAYLKGMSLFILTLPLLLLTVFFALEILIAYLQAYIYTFIACITIKDFI